MLSKHTKSHPVSIIQTIPLSPEEHFSPGRAMWQAAAQSTLQLMAEGRLWLDWSTGTLTIHSKIDINTYANAFGRCENQTAHFQFYHVTLDFLFLPRWLRYLSCASWELFGLSLHRLTVLSLEHIYNWHNHTVQTDEFVHVGQCSTLLELWPGPWNGIAKCCIPARILSGGGPFTDPIIRHTDGLRHLGYAGQTVRTDLGSVTCMKSSVPGFRNLQSWHVPKILLQQPPCSRHRYKHLVSLAQSFWSLNYLYYIMCSQVPRESRKIKGKWVLLGQPY